VSKAFVVAGLTLLVGSLAAQKPDTARAVTDTSHAHKLPGLTVEGARARAVAPPVATREVDSLTLKRTQAGDSWDLIRRTAGIEVHQQGQGPGFASDAVIRGFTSDHSSDVLLVIDGVPVNLPLHGHVEGYSDWNVLLTAAATQLRVINGPASPLYGDFAFGGVVEVTTPWGREGPPSAAIRGTSFGDFEGWTLAGHLEGANGWLAGARLERHDGWRPNSTWGLVNGILRGRMRVGSGALETGLLLYGSDWDSPGFLSVADFNAGLLRTPGDSTDGGSAARGVLQARYTRLLAEHLGLSVLGWGQGLRSTVFLNIPESDEDLHQTGEFDRRAAGGGEAQLNWHTTVGDLSLGAGGRYDVVRYRLTETVDREFQDTEASYAGSFASGYGFARWRELIGSFQLDLGLRLDALRYESRDRLAGTGDRTHTAVELDPKAGIRYLASDRVAVLASLSRGFRGAPGVIADPTLVPQHSWAKEIGIELFPGQARFRVSAFRFDVSRDRIQDPVTRTITDLGRSVRQGVELDAEVPVGSKLRLTASATFNDARLKTAGLQDGRTAGGVLASMDNLPSGRPADLPSLHVVPLEPGDPLPGVSRYLARLGLEASLTRRVMAGGLLRLNGPFTPIGEPGVRTRVYPLVDLQGSLLTGWHGWTLDWELQNLFNTRYPEVRASGYLNPGDLRVLRIAFRSNPQGA
jgi:outer membrane receptor protein involved in Fe transport